MGGITNLIKSGLGNSMNQLKSFDVGGQVSSALNSMNIPVPDVKIPDDIKLDVDLSDIKRPAGATSYISPLASKALSGVKLPSSIGGISLPELPDLSSVTSEVESALGGIGFDTKALGIRDVKDILKTPDLASLSHVDFASPVDLNNMPDVDHIMDEVNVSDIQSQIDEITSSIPNAEGIDISKYF